MSFEDTARDLFDLFQLAWKVVDNCRQTCGEQEPLSREVASLHAVVCQLQQEAERPNSSLHWQDDVSRKELETTIYGCQKALKVLNQVLEKYTLSRRRGGAKKGLFKSIRFGNGEVYYMSDLMEELSVHKAALSLNLRLLTPSSRGSVEWPLGKKFPGMQQSLHWMMAKISSSHSHDGSSQSSSYSDDEKIVWKEIRRGLVRDGWSRHDVKKHRKAIKEYVKMLGWTDTFDETPLPVHSSLHRSPQESPNREAYSPEPYRREASPQQDLPQRPLPPQSFPPQSFPPQRFPEHDFPQQDFPQNIPPPQNFPEPNFPPHNFPPPNFPQQNFSQTPFPQRILPQPDFPQQNFSRLLLPPPNLPQQDFSHQILPHPHFPQQNSPQQTFTRQIFQQEIYPQDDFPREISRPESARSDLRTTPPPPQYIPPSVSDDCDQFEEKPEFITLPPPPPPPHFIPTSPSDDRQQFDEKPDFITIPPPPPPPHFISPPVSDDHQQFNEKSDFITLPPPPPPPHFIPPPPSDDRQQFNENPGFVMLPPPPPVPIDRQTFEGKSDFVTLPPQSPSQFSARPYDLADTFQCSDKDTWNDMMESLVTILVDTSKNIYFPCSICKKLITTARARLDRSQNWCRNCFHSIIYNVLYYPSLPPALCNLRPISQKRMNDIVTPKFRSLWVNSYEGLRAMRGRPAGGMLRPSMEEPPLLLYRYPVEKKGEGGKVMRERYFEIAFFEEPFSEFVGRRKGKIV